MLFIAVWLIVGIVVIATISIVNTIKNPPDPEFNKIEAKRLMDKKLRRERWYDSHPFKR